MIGNEKLIKIWRGCRTEPLDGGDAYRQLTALLHSLCRQSGEAMMVVPASADKITQEQHYSLCAPRGSGGRLPREYGKPRIRLFSAYRTLRRWQTPSWVSPGHTSSSLTLMRACFSFSWLMPYCYANLGCLENQNLSWWKSWWRYWTFTNV